MSTTNMPCGKPTVVIPATGSLFHLDQAFVRLGFGDLLKSGKHRETTGRG